MWSFTLRKTGGTKVWDGWITRPKGNRGLPPSVLQGVTILSCWCFLCSNPVRYQQWDDRWVSSFSPSLSLGLTYKLWNFRDAASSVQTGSMQSCGGRTKLMDFSYYCPREEILVGLMGWGQGCRHLWSEAILENSSAPDKCFFFILKGKQLCCKRKRKCNEFDSDELICRGNVFCLLQCCPVACELNSFSSQSWNFTFGKTPQGCSLCKFRISKNYLRANSLNCINSSAIEIALMPFQEMWHLNMKSI